MRPTRAPRRSPSESDDFSGEFSDAWNNATDLCHAEDAGDSNHRPLSLAELASLGEEAQVTAIDLVCPVNPPERLAAWKAELANRPSARDSPRSRPVVQADRVADDVKNGKRELATRQASETTETSGRQTTRRVVETVCIDLHEEQADSVKTTKVIETRSVVETIRPRTSGPTSALAPEGSSQQCSEVTLPAHSRSVGLVEEQFKQLDVVDALVDHATQDLHASRDSDTESAVAVSCMRVRLGTLEFCSGLRGFGGLFDKVHFRILVHVGKAKPQWRDGGPMSQPLIARYGRAVSSDGQYSTRVTCDFDDVLHFPWPPDPDNKAVGTISADVWLERKGVIDRLDSLFDQFGLGGSSAAPDRVWLGRAAADLPPEGVDDAMFAWPVEVPGESISSDNPVPKTLAIAVEWVMEGNEET